MMIVTSMLSLPTDPGIKSKVWINDGNGNFTDSGQSLGSQSPDGELGDMDGDGDLDALIANETQGNKVWINIGNGIGDITLNQAASGSYTLTYDGSSTFSLSRDGGTAVDYVLTTDPASTGSSEIATFNLDGNAETRLCSARWQQFHLQRSKHHHTPTYRSQRHRSES